MPEIPQYPARINREEMLAFNTLVTYCTVDSLEEHYKLFPDTQLPLDLIFVGPGYLTFCLYAGLSSQDNPLFDTLTFPVQDLMHFSWPAFVEYIRENALLPLNSSEFCVIIADLKQWQKTTGNNSVDCFINSDCTRVAFQNSDLAFFTIPVCHELPDSRFDFLDLDQLS